MRRTMFTIMMSMCMLCFSGNIAEDQVSAKPVTGNVIEYVKKVDSTQVDSMNKKIAQDSIRQELYKEVESYIRKYTTRFDKDITKHLVDECIINGIDICFCLAQAQIETNFGTAGIGNSRKSMYGVYRTYKSRNASTTDWINLIKKNYLGQKKTIHHLMKNYVTLIGSYRYSSNKNYERDLKKTYTSIKNSTKIYKLQYECNTKKS